VKPVPELDAIDRRILEVLQEDALLSHAELAERVGSSSASCWRRVKALEAAGVLGPAVRLLNPEAVRRGVNVLCNVRMRSHSRDARSAFEEFVDTRPEVMESYSMSGEWDYLLRIVVSDVADYEHFLMRVLLEHPSVGTASSHFALSQTKYTTKLPI
jgi:Lrp/AsnC family transcriptional regulator